MQLAVVNNSAVHWLQELRFTTEAECMSILQTKSMVNIDTNINQPVAKNQTVKDIVDDIRQGARVIAEELLKLTKKVDRQLWKQAKSGCHHLARRLCRTLYKWNMCLPKTGNFIFHFNIHEEEEPLYELCSRLMHISNRFPDNSVMPEIVDGLRSLLTGVADTFASFIDLLLGALVRHLIESLDSNGSAVGAMDITAPLPSLSVLSMTVDTLMSLSLEGACMCRVVAREGGVQALLRICLQPRHKGHHRRSSRVLAASEMVTSASPDLICAQALRALATTCCVPEAVLELQKANGVHCLTKILCKSVNMEMVRSEAAGVIAQITSPCLGCIRHLSSFLDNVEDLIRSLTELCLNASTSDAFLLGVAAIANATFAEPQSSDYLLQYGTLHVLIEACHQPKADSLFAKDQIATVMANMATNSDCSEEIVSSNGVELLIQFLSEQPLTESHQSTPFLWSEAEYAACERLQQKAAIALSRLARDKENAQLIMELHGVRRLVQLCRDSKERHNSSAVLMACLAALRKVVSVCSTENHCAFLDLTPDDMQQLVIPKLMDSYLICCKTSRENCT